MQWLQLPAAERTLGDGMNEALLKILTPKAGKLSEAYAIAEVLAYCRTINRPVTLREYVRIGRQRAMQTASPQRYGGIYFAWWEVRNLRMAANIRAAVGARPGARVLNVVGASHKAFYDAYLEMMGDVVLVDVGTVLK